MRDASLRTCHERRLYRLWFLFVCGTFCSMLGLALATGPGGIRLASAESFSSAQSHPELRSDSTGTPGLEPWRHVVLLRGGSAELSSTISDREGSTLQGTTSQATSLSLSGCASAVLVSPDTVVTSAHVIDGLCQESTCRDLQVFRSKGIGDVPQAMEVRVELEHVFPAIDVAQLRVVSLDGAASDVPNIVSYVAAQPGEPIIAVGFPGCTTLQKAGGEVSALTPISFTVDALTTYGGSGSAVFNKDNQLIGIVSRASLDGSFLWRLVRGESFPFSSARIDTWSALRGLSLAERLQGEAKLLLKYYQEIQQPEFSFGQAALTIDFLSRVDRLRGDSHADVADSSSNAKGDPAARIFSEFHRHPRHLADLATVVSAAGEYADLAELVALYNLESFGLAGFLSRGVTESQIEVLKKDALSARAISQFERRGHSSDAQWPPRRESLYHELFLYALPFGAALAFLVLVWALSVGAVMALTPGRIGKKITVGVLVALLMWPLSLVVWSFSVRRLRRPARLSDQA